MKWISQKYLIRPVEQREDNQEEMSFQVRGEVCYPDHRERGFA